MTLGSVLSQGLRNAHLFVLAKMELHININSQVTTMLDKREKAKELKIDGNVGVAPKGHKEMQTGTDSDDDTAL